MKRQIHISEESLRSSYPTKSIEEVAKHHRCSTTVIYDRLHEYGIPLVARPLKPRVPISREELIARLADGKTVPEIAKDLRCGKTAIYRKIHKFGITLPPIKYSPKYDPANYAEDWLTNPAKQQAWAYLRLNTIDEDFRETTRVAIETLSPYAVTCSPPAQGKAE